MTRASAEGLTRDIAGWVAQLTWRDLPLNVRHHVSRLVLDYCAATVAGAFGDEGRAARRVAARVYRDGQSSIVASRLLLNAPGAAFANGTAAHGMELDDGYTPGSVHPGAVVISSALALGEELGSSAAEFASAVAAGYEVTCRIAAAGHPETLLRGFHNTGIAGVFGAAATAASLHHFDVGAVAATLGVAGSHASGLFEFLNSGGSVKRAHAGKAARDGIVSAEFVSAGIDGPATVLEGARGYFHAFVGETTSLGDVSKDLGVNWHLLGTYVKPYPCCRHLHSSIDAVDAILQRVPEGAVDPGEVAHVEVETYSVAAGHATQVAGSVLAAQLSLPFAVAVRLARGRVTVSEFSQSVLGDPTVVNLMRRVSVRTAGDLDAVYPQRRPSRVTLTMRNGTTLKGQIDQPLGEPDVPLTDAALEEKLRTCADGLLPVDAVEDLIAAVWEMESPDTLGKLLAGDLV